jgi:hypothetical protein
MVEVYVAGGEYTKSAILGRNLLIMKSLLRPLLALSLAWNIYLVAGVIFNQSYALTRAAGGQYETFPTGIRAAYLLTLAILVYQVLLFFTHIKRPMWIYKAFFLLGIASTLMNAMSRSGNERWNAIPAAVIAYGFFDRNSQRKNFNA